jgi:hypothetical protein
LDFYFFQWWKKEGLFFHWKAEGEFFTFEGFLGITVSLNNRNYRGCHEYEADVVGSLLFRMN